jgi:hypothetical protein
MATLHLDPLPRSATAGEVLRFVCDAAGIDGKLVGKITFHPKAATVELPDTHAVRAVAALDGAAFRERRVRARLAFPPQSDAPHAEHFGRLARLLDLEAEEERRRLKDEAKASRGKDTPDDPFGITLKTLTVSQEDYGLGGRLLLTFARKGTTDPLPPNRLGPGSPVLLTQTGVPRPVSLRGVVLDRAERSVTVAFEEPDDDLPADATWRLDLSPDEAARQRQLGALYRVQAADKDRLADLRAVLLGERQPEQSPPIAMGGLSPLNPSQLAAVDLALSAKDVACIHGPPGTGKTTAVVELIRRAVARGETVLACAPSNAAVDNLLEKLLAAGLEPVRLGHPARVAADLRGRALDLLVESHPDARQAKKFTREAYALFRKADKWTRAKPQPGEKQAQRAEARDLLAEARKLEQHAEDKVLDEARVVCATLTGLDSETLGRRRYDLAVIDEACQTTEPASWIPLLRAGRVVFAGDPCQLPPTILSPQDATQGLSVSLMERVMALHGPAVSRLLTVQYRMHERIMGFSNAEFYDGELVADESVTAHRLCDLPGVIDGPLTETPVRFIDTAGAGYDEELEEDTDSRLNRQEADLSAKRVRELLAAGVPAADIAVITPYAAQVRRLRELLKGTGVEIDSVDGFQGREKEAVVISFVRSNPEGEIGFLADFRRTNVALTRARRCLIVIGDSATLSNHPFYQRLLGYFELIGAYGSVWEEPG